MKKDLKDWIVPWLFTSREYNVGILDKAMDNPDTARLMLNENPIPPSEKVIEAVVDSLQHGNWYPDSFLRLRTKIGKMYGSGSGQCCPGQRIFRYHRRHDAGIFAAGR